MRLFGLEITRKRAAMAPVPRGDGGWATVFDWKGGAWQQDAPPVSTERALAFHAVYACITRIASDVGSLRPKLVEKDADGIWAERTSPAFSPVLRRPNRFQNHIQFKEWWITSKLIRGNAYALKERDNRGVVVALYLLDSSRCQPMVAPDSSIWYDLGEDSLAGLDGASLVVPASEIIHDRMNCLFHPLVGVSPLYANALAAGQGLAIQEGSSKFFANNSSPGGILTAPAQISEDTAKRLKEHWEKNYTGNNAGKIAVLGDGLKFEPMRMSAEESQLAEQLKITAEIVCSTFHVPAFMAGVGPVPPYANVEAVWQHYYSFCLRKHIEDFEACMDEGLGLDGVSIGVELDLDSLLRMDTATQINALKTAIDGSLMAPNEGRKRLNLGPLEGGDTIYMQQQQFSLAALAERDSDKPFSKPAAPAPAVPATPAEPEERITEAAVTEIVKQAEDRIRREITAQREEAEAEAEVLALIKRFNSEPACV